MAISGAFLLGGGAFGMVPILSLGIGAVHEMRDYMTAIGLL